MTTIEKLDEVSKDLSCYQLGSEFSDAIQYVQEAKECLLRLQAVRDAAEAVLDYDGTRHLEAKMGDLRKLIRNPTPTPEKNK